MYVRSRFVPSSMHACALRYVSRHEILQHYHVSFMCADAHTAYLETPHALSFEYRQSFRRRCRMGTRRLRLRAAASVPKT